MRDKLIKNIKCHVGIHQFAGQMTIARTKPVGGKDREEFSFELWPMGVFVSCLSKPCDVLVPFTNITGIEYEIEKSGLTPAA